MKNRRPKLNKVTMITKYKVIRNNHPSVFGPDEVFAVTPEEAAEEWAEERWKTSPCQPSFVEEDVKVTDTDNGEVYVIKVRAKTIVKFYGTELEQ